MSQQTLRRLLIVIGVVMLLAGLGQVILNLGQGFPFLVVTGSITGACGIGVIVIGVREMSRHR